MRRIANAIEYSPTALYLHFPDKRTLLEALCNETFARLIQRLERQKRRHRDPMTALRDGLLTYVTFGLEHPHHYTVTFILGAQGPSPPDYAGSIGAQAFGILQEAVQAARAAGVVASEDPEATAQSLWAAAHGVTSLLIQHPHFPFVSRKKLAAHTIDTILRGLRP